MKKSGRLAGTPEITDGGVVYDRIKGTDNWVVVPDSTSYNKELLMARHEESKRMSKKYEGKARRTRLFAYAIEDSLSFERAAELTGIPEKWR
jgi:hypothetical protein